jgi:signal transduction histidine kinase/ligand-binding sensor domain-containing protein
VVFLVDPVRSLFVTIVVAATPMAQDLAIGVLPFPGARGESRTRGALETSDGRLWFLFQTEVACHDGRTLSAIQFPDQDPERQPSNLRAIVEAESGVYLAGEKGIWQVRAGTSSAIYFDDTRALAPTHVAEAGGGALWILSQRGELMHRARDGRIVNRTADLGVARVAFLTADRNNAWAGSEAGLHRLRDTGADSPAVGTVRLTGLRAATTHGDAVFAVTKDGVHRIDATGRSRVLVQTDRLVTATAIAVGGDTGWVCGRDGLHSVDLEAGTCRRVRLFHDRDELGHADTGAVALDRQGLLWVGSRTRFFRGQVHSGVENVRISALPAEDATCAMVEHGGQLWLGTEQGRLLREAGDQWHLVATPWSIASQSGVGAPESVLVLHSAPSGHLCVGTRKKGAWTLHESWHRIAEIEQVRGLASDGDRLWLAAERCLASVDLDAGDAVVASVHQTLPRPSYAGRMLCDSDGTLWLAAYRGGLWRRLRGEATFQTTPGWDGEAVIDVVADHRSDSLLVTCRSGIWRFGLRNGERHAVGDPAAISRPRTAVALADGTLWVTEALALTRLDPREGTVDRLSFGLGAHPLGFTFRAECLRRDGEVWLGAKGGYTRLLPGAHRRLERPLQPTLVRISVNGDVVHDGGLPAALVEVPAGGVLDVLATLVDRRRDDVTAHEIVLTDEHGNVRFRRDDGHFVALPSGSYGVRLSWARVSGGAVSVALATVQVLPPATGICVAAAIAAAAAAVLLASLRAGRGSRPRMVDFDASRRIASDQPELVLEMAWLAAVAGEVVAAEMPCEHVTVWMRQTAARRRVRIAAFGATCADAEQRTAACCEQGVEVGEQVFLLEQRGSHDLVLCVSDARQTVIEIFLHRLPNAYVETIVRIEQLAAPLLARVGKSQWIDRLEADYVRKGVTLETETHDLKNPLTVLRLAAHELDEMAAEMRNGRLENAAATVTTAVNTVLSAIERLAGKFDSAGNWRLTEHDPAQLALKVARQMQYIAAAKNVRLVTYETIVADRVLLDEAWFSRIVENVLGNAIKYSPPGTTVRLSYVILDDEFRLHVDDEGPGFDAVEREAVFLPGFIGSAKPTAGESASGLGLWIARQAMRAMRGQIRVGDKPGRGARIILSLPRHAEIRGAARS